MRRDAESALDGLSTTSGYRCHAHLVHGYSVLFGGDADRADPIFAQTVDVGLRARHGPATVVALAERGFCALGRGDWPAVERFVEEAHSGVQQFDLWDYTTSALSFIWRRALRFIAAMSNGHETRSRVRRGCGHCSPTRVPTIQYERWSSSPAPISRSTTPPAHGKSCGRRATCCRNGPILGVLPKEVDELESKLGTMRPGSVGPSTLTVAELRLVPFLPTHLTYPQIGARLYLSRNTVKSQAISIYQKLDVSSCDEAIERLREIGLL